jgi:hypothetical protein
MNVRDIPIVGWIRRAGADDPVFDTLLILGPVLVLDIAVTGRSPVTVALATLYLVVFVGTILSKSRDRIGTVR